MVKQNEAKSLVARIVLPYCIELHLEMEADSGPPIQYTRSTLFHKEHKKDLIDVQITFLS